MATGKAIFGRDRVGPIYRALRGAIIDQALGKLAAEWLMELRRNRGAAVATANWQEARDTFDMMEKSQKS